MSSYVFIYENSFALAVKQIENLHDNAGLFYSKLNTLVRVCRKLSRINEVYMLNLGLTMIKQETTAPQIISFHRTLQRENNKQRTP